MSGNAAKLRSVARGKDEPGSAAGTVGRAISDDLRRLQSQRRSALDLDGIVSGLARSLPQLLAAGHLVSLSATRDGRAVRLSVLDGKEWIEFFSSDPDHAEELSDAITATLGPLRS